MGIVMNLAGVIERVVDIQKDIEITQPKPLKPRAVYPEPPRPNDALTVPCWMNTFSFVEEVRRSNLRTHRYQIWMQFFVSKSMEQPVSDRALAVVYHDAVVKAFDLNVMLGSGVTVQQLRGNSELRMPARLLWNDIGYLGLEYMLEVTIQEDATFAA